MLISPSLEDVLPSVLLAKKLATEIDTLAFDAVIGYHWESLGAMVEIQTKKIGIVGDPINLSWRFRRTVYSHLDDSETLKMKIFNWIHRFSLEDAQKKAMSFCLSKMDYCGAFAAHHATELSLLAKVKCEYFRTPVPRTKKEYYNKSPQFKILLLGHLYGISTLSGVELYLKEIHPNLNISIGYENFEVHIVGGNYASLPQDLKDIAEQQDNIYVRGHIVPPDKEIETSHIILVPTPIELGIRVRIITALQFGAIVVTHSANQKGIPEISHKENVITGSDALQIQHEIFEIFNAYENFSEIKNNAYNTYSKYFTPEQFYNQLSKYL